MIWYSLPRAQRLLLSAYFVVAMLFVCGAGTLIVEAIVAVFKYIVAPTCGG